MWFKRKADTGDNGKDLPITVSCIKLSLNFSTRPSEGCIYVIYQKWRSLIDRFWQKVWKIDNIELDLSHKWAADVSSFFTFSFRFCVLAKVTIKFMP